MASTYEEKKKEEQQTSATSGYKGTSAATQQQLNTLQQGYKPSQNVQNAQQQLTQVQSARPAAYTSPYSQQLDDIYQQIVNRKPFNYNMNGDMLYQNAKDQYVQGGRQAMMDTMGQAAAMSGGYGSSYASTAGNQAYQQYLLQLNSMIPDFYDRAAARYDQQGNELMNQYSMMLDKDNTAYGRYQDNLNQWNQDMAVAQNAYNNAYSQDYGAYQDTLSYWQQMASAENQNYWNERSQAYEVAMSMLSSGRLPSEDLLALAGIPLVDAQAMIKQTSSGSGSGTTAQKFTINVPKQSNEKLSLAEYYAQGGTTPIEDGYGPVNTAAAIEAAQKDNTVNQIQKKLDEEVMRRSLKSLYMNNR